MTASRRVDRRPGSPAGHVPGRARSPPTRARRRPVRRITATAGLELRMTLRNGEQLLLALVIPLVALIGGTLITVVDLPEPRVDAVVPGRAGAGGAVVGVHLAGHHHRVRPALRGAQTAGRRRGRPRAS